MSPPETFAERDDDRTASSVDLPEIQTAAERDDTPPRPPIGTRADRDDPHLRASAISSEIVTKADRDDRGPRTSVSEIILTEAARDDDKGTAVPFAGLAADDLISGTTGY